MQFLQAYEEVRTDEGNPRFMHAWKQNDGIFCMRVEDFLEYFTQIVVCRDFTGQFHGVEYDQPWKLQDSFLATRSKPLKQDRQFLFSQTRTASAEPVNVTAIMTQQDPRLDQTTGAPYDKHRISIGMLVMEVGNRNSVKEGGQVCSFEPNKEKAQKQPKPFRTIVVQFAVPPGKYAVIPLVLNCPNPEASRYSLRLYFDCQQDAIKLHSNEPVRTVLQYMADRGPARNPNFAADEGSHISVARDAFARKVMTPYSLDGIINSLDLKKKKKVSASTIEMTIATNKKNFETKNMFYEDNAMGNKSQNQHKLVSGENIQLSEQSRQQQIMGIDPDEVFGDPNWIEKQTP